jgi:hypothetical protein
MLLFYHWISPNLFFANAASAFFCPSRVGYDQARLRWQPLHDYSAQISN